MRIEIDQGGNFVLKEVFTSVVLRTSSVPTPEEFAICMRDSGFEFKYDGRWYEAKGGEVTECV